MVKLFYWGKGALKFETPDGRSGIIIYYIGLRRVVRILEASGQSAVESGVNFGHGHAVQACSELSYQTAVVSYCDSCESSSKGTVFCVVMALLTAIVTLRFDCVRGDERYDHNFAKSLAVFCVGLLIS